MTDLEIRRAGDSESARLTDIAHAAKAHWGYPDDWLRLWDAELTLSADFVHDHPVFVAVSGDVIAGVYALGGERAELELEHFWVDPPFIGQGIGRRLFRHACATAADLGARSLLIASDPNAEAFYSKLGARTVGSRPSTPKGRTLPLMTIELPVAG